MKHVIFQNVSKNKLDDKRVTIPKRECSKTVKVKSGHLVAAAVPRRYLTVRMTILSCS
jgi:hypothetical protein